MNWDRMLAEFGFPHKRPNYVRLFSRKLQGMLRSRTHPEAGADACARIQIKSRPFKLKVALSHKCPTMNICIAWPCCCSCSSQSC